jgi:hypothetical protein
VLIEIQTRDSLAVHTDVAAAVDSLLRGYLQQPERRWRDEESKIHIEKAPSAPKTRQRTSHGVEGPRRRREGFETERAKGSGPSNDFINSATRTGQRRQLDKIRIYPYGVARNRLTNASKRMRVPAELVRDVNEADVLVTLRTYYRKRQRTVIDAEHRGMPVYVLRANTVSQMERFLGDVFNLAAANSGSDQTVEDAVSDTQRAIETVLNGERWVELTAASSFVRRVQHKMAKQANLVSHSYGKEPNRRVRIFRE